MPGLGFPNPAFEAVYAGLLIAALAAAAWVDARTLRLPKRLTVGLLVAGLVANLARGAWLGAAGSPVWAFESAHPLLGASDAFLFAVSGALVGFVLFTALWLTGAVLGGGDVKLATAAGAWLGPKGLLLAAFVSLGVFTVFGLGRLAVEVFRGVRPTLAPRPAGLAGPGPGGRKARSRVSYSLSFAVAVAVVLALAHAGKLGALPLVGD